MVHNQIYHKHDAVLNQVVAKHKACNAVEKGEGPILKRVGLQNGSVHLHQEKKTFKPHIYVLLIL